MAREQQKERATGQLLKAWVWRVSKPLQLLLCLMARRRGSLQTFPNCCMGWAILTANITSIGALDRVPWEAGGCNVICLQRNRADQLNVAQASWAGQKGTGFLFW